MFAKQTIEQLLKYANIALNGSEPWDIQVHNEQLYKRVISGGSLAFGESYMEGWWTSDQLDETIARIHKANLTKKIGISPALVWLYISSFLTNTQNEKRAKIVGEQHYDLGNDLYEAMLDKRMVYTCGYWKNATNLDEAQEAKLDLICKKIGLKKGMTVLDIGCGWGSFAKFAAEKYGAVVTGITVSKEQIEFAKKQTEGLPVTFELKDYRCITGKYDRVVSIGMIEHVGYKNYRTYMKIVHRVLSEAGIFLLHTIGTNVSVKHTDPWIEKYIFPNGMLPSASQLTKAYEKLFVMEDWHNFGTDYDKTLMAWFNNFDSAWESLKNNYENRLNGKFYNM